MTGRQGRLAIGLQYAAHATELDPTSTEAQESLQRLQARIDNCGLDPGLFWQWQHCLDQRAKLERQLLEELGQDSRQLSEYSKNVATELLVGLRGYWILSTGYWILSRHLFTQRLPELLTGLNPPPVSTYHRQHRRCTDVQCVDQNLCEQPE